MSSTCISLVAVTVLFFTGCDLPARVEPNTSDAQPDSGIAVKVIPTSPDEQEQSARQLAPCRAPAPDAGWQEHRDTRGRARWRLPADYRIAHGEPRELDQQLWTSADSSVVVLTFHAGDGLTSTMISLADSVTAMVDNGWCSLRLAGRTAAVANYRLVMANGDTLFVASADAGIRAGFGIGAAVLTRAARSRSDFLAALTTLQLLQ